MLYCGYLSDHEFMEGFQDTLNFSDENFAVQQARA